MYIGVNTAVAGAGSSKCEVVIDYSFYTAYVHIWTYSPLITNVILPRWQQWKPYGHCTLLLLWSFGAHDSYFLLKLSL